MFDPGLVREPDSRLYGFCFHSGPPYSYRKNNNVMLKYLSIQFGSEEVSAKEEVPAYENSITIIVFVCHWDHDSLPTYKRCPPMGGVLPQVRLYDLYSETYALTIH